MCTIENLDLHGAKVTEAGMRQLARMTGLTALGLQETEVGNEGVAQLKSLAPTLERLYLGYTKVTAACVPHLQTFTSLRTLMLRGTQVGSEEDEPLTRTLTRLGRSKLGSPSNQEGLIR
jgi:hypothetical protein